MAKGFLGGSTPGSIEITLSSEAPVISPSPWLQWIVATIVALESQWYQMRN